MPTNQFSDRGPRTSTVITQADNWVVQKFGGTSIGKFAPEIVETVIRPSLAGDRVAIVCSARSNSSKLEGTTNRLLRAARDAEQSQSKHFTTLINAIQLEHTAVANDLISDADLRQRLVIDIEQECSHVLCILEAAQILGETSAKCVDMVMSAGEKLSCRFMSTLLQDHDIDAQYVDLTTIIDFASEHLDQRFYDNLAYSLGKKVLSCTGKVPVITGYFGLVPGGLLDKIGRGYTDLCAALVAVGIKARELQVWKEVDGIFTADPRKVPTARLLGSITPAEAAELTFYGSEVIHPFTMEQVIRSHIPIRIKNVMNPRNKGTQIVPNESGAITPTKLIRARGSSCMMNMKDMRPKRPTAVTAKKAILVINIHSNKRSLSHGFFANIFTILDKWRLSIDLISTSEVHVSMALHSEVPLLNGLGEDDYQITDEDLKGAINDLTKLGTVDVVPDMCILSLVGKQMKNMMGIAGRMFSTLGDHNVNIEMISQGASEINISCVIEERDADRAVNILHTNLFTFLD